MGPFGAILSCGPRIFAILTLFRVSSGNCAKGGRECQYAQAQLPLRERNRRELRAIIPGENTPWTPSRVPSSVVLQVSRPLSNTAVDPFGTLPGGMAHKALELLHYCQSTSRPHIHFIKGRQGGKEAYSVLTTTTDFTYDPTKYDAASKPMKVDGYVNQHPSTILLVY